MLCCSCNQNNDIFLSPYTSVNIPPTPREPTTLLRTTLPESWAFVHRPTQDIIALAASTMPPFKDGDWQGSISRQCTCFADGKITKKKNKKDKKREENGRADILKLGQHVELSRKRKQEDFLP